MIKRSFRFSFLLAEVRRHFRFYAFVISSISCLFFSNTSFAAEIRVVAGINNQSSVVFVSGAFLMDDNKRFIQQTISLDKAIIVFNSLGGNLFAGIEIGKAIRLKDFSTYVSHESYCASACALAWLGGTKRFMSRNSRVGFHAAYKEISGVASESGMGNALVGAYLNSLGLPTRAVAYITAAAPDSMQWLTQSDAIAVGIDATLYEIEGSNPPSRRQVERPVPSERPAPSERPSTAPAAPKSRVADRICQENPWHECVGTTTSGSGKTFTGYYVNNKKNGQGQCTSPDGSRTFYGLWKNGDTEYWCPDKMCRWKNPGDYYAFSCNQNG